MYWLRGKLTRGLDYSICTNSLNETFAGVRFRVTGYVLIKENKIQVWLDFGYRNAKQLIKPAPKASQHCYFAQADFAWAK